MHHAPVRLLQESLFLRTAVSPEKTAITAEGKAFTYRQLLETSRCCAGALISRGLSRGDRVAIYMDNTFTCAASIYGVLMAGGVFMVVNPQTKVEKLSYMLKDSGASFLITDGHLESVFLPAVAENIHLQGIFCSGTLPPDITSAKCPLESFDTIIAESESSLLPQCNALSIDLAALIYTSGSTGNPKGVMMTHSAMVFTTHSLIQYLRLSKDHRILNVLPMAFDYGLYQLLMSVSLGATLVLERSFTYPALAFKRMTEHEITVFPGVPTIFATMVTMHRKNPLCFPSVTRITNTAAALPVDYQETLHQIFPNALIYRMYGLTECKRVCYLEPELADKKPTSVGKAIPGTETYILSPEGRICGPGETGILHVRGQHVMKGYWKQPELSSKMLRPGPLPGEFVLCAQDWFKMDKDGDLYFLGRNDDIIKTRGEKVSPVEVENVLYGIHGIREAAVLGEKDDTLGEAIVAYIALSDGVSLNEKDIKKSCLANLENFMVPKRVVFLPALPKTETGKITKKGLPELEKKSL